MSSGALRERERKKVKKVRVMVTILYFSLKASPFLHINIRNRLLVNWFPRVYFLKREKKLYIETNYLKNRCRCQELISDKRNHLHYFTNVIFLFPPMNSETGKR